MLRLYDPRTGLVSDIHPARPGRLVIQVPPGADLRELVLADTIRRIGERQRLTVFLFSERAAEPLNVPSGMAETGATADLAVGDGVGEISPRRTLELGGCDGVLPTPEELTARGLDPLALRLALLRRHYRESVSLTWEELADCDDDLSLWRAEMASWARSPGRPMSKEHIAEAEAAYLDDLNLGGVIRVMRDLAEDGSVQPGARFESFVQLDLVLGLDLVADLGRA